MKKYLLILPWLLPFTASALESEPPVDILYKTDMYGLKISHYGRYIGSRAGDASVYDIDLNRLYDYWGSFLGLGNCVSDMGVAVGDSNDIAAILFEGETIRPDVFNDYWFCDLHAITPDATRLCGIVNNPQRGSYYLPFYCDIDADLNLSEPHFLPTPDRDFFGTRPQYSSAVWISDDGKTIVGEMVDGRGMYTVPIVYCENEEGEWSYLLPSQQLFNPTGLPLPERNGEQGPPVPQYTDYMNDVQKAAYEQKLEEWAESGYNEALYPEPQNYMTEEQWAQYNAAAEAYNKWHSEHPDGFKSYEEAYNDIKKTSPSFSQNEMTLSPDGSFMMVHGSLLDDDLEEISYIYRFDIPGPDYTIYQQPLPYNPYPSQILDDGTAIAATRLMEVPTSFILRPGETEWIPFTQYLVEEEYPYAALWIEENFPGGSGVVSMSCDKSVMIGALMPDQLAYYDYEFPDFYYSTYIFIPGSEINGIESLVAEPSNGIYRVYSLQGVKLLETREASALASLPSGLYIINGRKFLVK